MSDHKSDLVFVVMQVGEAGSPERKRADDVYEYVIKPVVEELALIPYRADLDPSPGSITPKMLTELLTIRAVIADLTGRNPNVNYELGIVHSFARPVVCIADSTSSIPFDTKDERTIPIGKVPEGGLAIRQAEAAKANLRRSLDVILAEGYELPRHLQTARTARGAERVLSRSTAGSTRSRGAWHRTPPRSTTPWRRRTTRCVRRARGH